MMRSPTKKLPESNEKTDEVHFEQRSRQASDERRSNLTVVRREEAKPNAEKKALNLECFFLWRCPPDSVVDFGTLSMSFRAEVRRTGVEESASAYQTSRLPLEVTGKALRLRSGRQRKETPACFSHGKRVSIPRR